MYRSSREIIFRFNSKTQWQMFLLLYDHHVCVPPKGTNMASAYSPINLGDTLLRITREWKTAEIWFVARLFIWQSSQILDFIYWNGYDFKVLITWLMKTENTYRTLSPDPAQFAPPRWKGNEFPRRICDPLPQYSFTMSAVTPHY